MTKRLTEILQEYVGLNGNRGTASLMAAIDRGEKTIDSYRKGLAQPTPEQVRKLALACGCSDKEALALASEASQEKAKDTA